MKIGERWREARIWKREKREAREARSKKREYAMKSERRDTNQQTNILNWMSIFQFFSLRKEINKILGPIIIVGPK
jgi:hypothetical protein